MNDMEKKLAQYRAKKAREAKINEMKTKTSQFFSSFWKRREKSPDKVEDQLLPSEEDETGVAPLEDASSVISEEEVTISCTLSDIFYYLLWFVLWIILYAIFIEFQFGTVFLIVSGIVFMFINTRTGPKRNDEVSAYSVFNKNCESIDGTLKAEQFEREIRYGQLM